MGVRLANQDLGECLDSIRSASRLASKLEPFRWVQAGAILVDRIERGMDASQRLRCPDALPGFVHVSSLALPSVKIE